VVTILRPLSTSELLDRTFHLYRNNFWLFVGIAAIPQLFVFSLHMVDAALWLRRIIASQGLRTLLFVLASLLAVEISHAATVVGVSDLYLSRAASITKAYSVARASILRVIGIGIVAFWIPLVLGLTLGVMAASASAAILAATGIFGGAGSTAWIRAITFVAAFLAGPLLALRWWLAWSLVIPVTVIEGGGLRASMRRSSSLTKSRRGRIFCCLSSSRSLDVDNCNSLSNSVLRHGSVDTLPSARSRRLIGTRGQRGRKSVEHQPGRALIDRGIYPYLLRRARATRRF